VKKISDAAIQLAFARHELTTTEYEAEDYGDVEEGVDAFKELVEGVQADVLACLTGDETGCLDPEDINPENETVWTQRMISTQYQRGLDAGREEAAKIAETFKGGYSVNHVDGLLEPDPDGPWCLGGDVASAIRSRIGKGVEDGE
jgi:hypothetical protein